MSNGVLSPEAKSAPVDGAKADSIGFSQLPWQKLIVWGLFLLALYALRHFTFVVFMTFLLSYFVRAAVVAIAHKVSPNRERPGLEQLLTVMAFSFILLSGYLAWVFLVPRVFEQARAIVTRVQHFDVQHEFDNLLNRTVGSYLFRQRYGQPDDPRYEEAFRAFRAKGRSGEGLYRQFPSLRASLVAGFEARYEGQELRELQEEVLQGGAALKKFDRWFLEVKAPGLLERHREAYLTRWQNRHATPEGARQLTALQKAPDFASRRDEEVLRLVLEDAKKDPVTYGELRKEWEQATVRQRWQELRRSPGYQARFRQYYQERREANPEALPFDYDLYARLERAFPKGKEPFALTLDGLLSTDDDPGAQSLARADFGLTMRHQLARTWWAEDPMALSLRQQFQKALPSLVTDFEGWIGNLLREAVALPVELLTAFLLALYITYDLQSIRTRLGTLRQTRLGIFHDELAPELVTFGQLVGRFMQVRAVIALFNTICTVVALWLLGIENEVLLGMVVFVASFIPYVGVFLSGIPIAVLAVVQPGGSMGLAAQAVLAITVIHLVEAHLLQPLIVARVAHMHAATAVVVLVLGEYFFGIWGLLLGVPVAVHLGRLLGLEAEPPDRPIPRTTRFLAFLRAAWSCLKKSTASFLQAGPAQRVQKWLSSPNRVPATFGWQPLARRRILMNDAVQPGAAEAGRRAGRWFTGLGIVLIVLGLVALSHSVLATVVTLEVCGWLLLIAGALQFTHAVWSPDWRGFFSHALYGMLGAVVGLLVVVRPLVGAEAVSLLIAAYFLVGGLLEIMAAVAAYRQNWTWIAVYSDDEAVPSTLELGKLRQHRYWLVLSGVLHLALGALVLSFWPKDSLWLVGLFVGISLLMSGVWWLTLGLIVQSFAKQALVATPEPEPAPPEPAEVSATPSADSVGLARARQLSENP